jgi:hypothetical protein
MKFYSEEYKAAINDGFLEYPYVIFVVDFLIFWK